MEKDIPLKLEVEYAFVTRRIRILAIAIILGFIIVFVLGLFTPVEILSPDLNYLSYVSVILCAVLCVSSFYIKKLMLKNLKADNFLNSYFNIHAIPFAVCDLGGLLCIATNLFINRNLIYASGGLLIGVLYIIINMPKKTEIESLKT